MSNNEYRISKSIFFRSLFLIRNSIFVILLFSAAPAGALTGDELLHRMQKKFLGQDIKSLTYVENRVVITKVRENSIYNGTIPFNKKNVTRQKLRYYYKAPNRHRYRFLSEKKVKITEIGEPDQATVEMDEEWEKRITENYTATLLADQTYRGRKCYVLNLIPRPENRFPVPMTWYIDKKRLIVLKFVSLADNSVAGKLSTKGELFYRRIDGRLLLSSARWVQTPSTIPQKYEFKVYFGKYEINGEISDSVFE